LSDRVSSGIGGFDTILAGGFIPGGITIVQGRPGAGKTILGNQMCFNHARAGGKALYVTLLAESRARMLMHLSNLDFFDQSAIPDRVYYVSAFSVLEADGLRGLLDLLRREVRAHGATMLVLDGLVAADLQTGSDVEFKKFIHELQIQATVTDCSMFLLTSGDADNQATAEHTMVDCAAGCTGGGRSATWRCSSAAAPAICRAATPSPSPTPALRCTHVSRRCGAGRQALPGPAALRCRQACRRSTACSAAASRATQ